MNLNPAAQPYTWDHQKLINYLATGRNPVITSPIILHAFSNIDRQLFVPEEHSHSAYLDKQLTLEFNKRIPSPSLIARKLEIVSPFPGMKFLHLGTGSGYFAALLGSIAGNTGEVYSLERIQWLWERARQIQRQQALPGNLKYLYRDAMSGLTERAPYDRIIFSFIPTAETVNKLLEQLNQNGKLIYPNYQHQLVVIERAENEETWEERFPDFSAFEFDPEEEGLG